MADKLMRAQVTIPLVGGLPIDYPTNTFYFDGDDGLSDGQYHGGVMDLLTTFYQAIDGVIFPTEVDSPATVKIYDMRDALPRLPEFEGTIDLTPLAGSMHPSEVAICLSFKAAYVSGVPNARRRGRVFLGPVVEVASRSIVDGQSRIAQTVIDDICDAAAVMEDGTVIAGGLAVKWAVYSPKTDETETIDDSFNDVLDGWVDNAWDTQRRRGAAATSRTTWS